MRTKPWEFQGRRMERNAPQGYRCDETCDHPSVTAGTKICLCPVCHTVFSTPANFDRHRHEGWCLEPSAVGLEANERGVWGRRMDLAVLNRLRGHADSEDDE